MTNLRSIRKSPAKGLVSTINDLKREAVTGEIYSVAIVALGPSRTAKWWRYSSRCDAMELVGALEMLKRKLLEGID